MAKSSFIEKLNILDGLVIYNSFDIDEDVSFEDQWYSYSEDILQIKFGERFVLDVGWYPESDLEGKFIVYAILDQNWDNPLMTITCTLLEERKKIKENYKELKQKYDLLKSKEGKQEESE